MSANQRFVAPTFSLAEASDFTNRLREDRNGFCKLAAQLRRLTGINLQPTEKNLSLMAGRLGPMMRDFGVGSYSEYDSLLFAGDRDLTRAFVAALTTHTTDFFREPAHFDVLRELAPSLVENARRDGVRELRVWSAAASSGQELYTLAMTLSEVVPEIFPHGVRLLGTDVDVAVLEKAAAGVYTEGEVQSVPPIYRQKYYREASAGGNRRWRVKEALAAVVRFAPLNLAANEYPFKHRFDVVFCRNVLIYFDREAGAAVIERLLGSVRPGGYLFLGHSETGTIRSPEVETIATAVYRKKSDRR